MNFTPDPRVLVPLAVIVGFLLVLGAFVVIGLVI